VVVGLLLAGCDRAPDIHAEPPEIIYGETVCDRCNMIISEPRFAAAYWTADGDPYRFDDLGEMILFYQETSPEVASFWVHDYDSVEWLPAEDATFVTSMLQTPMGFGTIAFAEPAAAEAWAAEHDGELLTFEELLAQPADMPMGAMDEHAG
jgi:copper chaperone NosL